MSPWDIIGWAIALPIAAMALLFLGALVVGLGKYAVKKASKPEPAKLRLVEDDEPA